MFQRSLKEGLFRLKQCVFKIMPKLIWLLLPTMYYSHSCQVQQASHYPVSSLY